MTIEIFTLGVIAFDVLPRETTFPKTGQNRVVTEIIETAVLWALKAV